MVNTVTVSGLTYPSADGSADQYLKTDGSGTTFATAFRHILDAAGHGVPLCRIVGPDRTGYLIRQSAVSRTTYADLFSAISTTYGWAWLSDTFTFRTFVDRVDAGKGDMAHLRLVTDEAGGSQDTLGATVGADDVTLSEANLASHGSRSKLGHRRRSAEANRRMGLLQCPWTKAARHHPAGRERPPVDHQDMVNGTNTLTPDLSQTWSKHGAQQHAADHHCAELHDQDLNGGRDEHYPSAGPWLRVGVITDVPGYNIPLNAYSGRHNVVFDEGKVRRAPIFRKVKDSLGFSPRFAIGITPLQATIRSSWSVMTGSSRSSSQAQSRHRSGSITGSSDPRPFTGTILAMSSTSTVRTGFRFTVLRRHEFR